ncbi:hypothetical protein [Streptomyces sp. NPDC037389]|uniref:hypothetical protein n=1 Tax=Streptomyces sp. NPDC037389 TaxID=3155369 RepID=UPI0033D45248
MALHGERCGLRMTADPRYGAGVTTVRQCVPGQVLAYLAGGVPVSGPSRTSVQVDVDRHLESTGIEGVRYVNHSCAPTAVLDTGLLVLRAVRELVAGDSVTLFYPATEWDMAEPFTCLCQENGCLGRVAGARFLSDAQLSGYRVSAHIQRLRSGAC